MNYKTFTPDPLLASFVKCYWTMEQDASGAGIVQRIVPDGCMEMIFHCGDSFRQHNNDGSYRIQPLSFVFGQITMPLEIAPEGVVSVVATRFYPGGFSVFSTMPVSEMDNRAVSLAELFGEEGSLLQKVVLSAPDMLTRIALVEAFLLRRLVSMPAVDRIVRTCVDLLMESHGQVSVMELSSVLKSSRRKIERRFSSSVGLSPGKLARIIRLQTALRALKERPELNLTELACECGYFDQAHFIREFRAFTGVTPGQFYSANTRMTSFFSESA